MRAFFSKILYVILIRPWLKLIIGVRYRNKKIVNDTPQYILVANHNSHFDTLSIMAAIRYSQFKKTHAVAVEDYFGKTSLSAAAVRFFFNAILIGRSSKESKKDPIQQMSKALDKGQSLILYPEGTRGQPGVMQDFKRGVAVLLKDHPNVPFIPVFLEGFGKVLPKSKTLILPMNCTVRFGKPVFPKSTEIEDILGEVKTAILALQKRDERYTNDFENI